MSRALHAPQRSVMWLAIPAALRISKSSSPHGQVVLISSIGGIRIRLVGPDRRWHSLHWRHRPRCRSAIWCRLTLLVRITVSRISGLASEGTALLSTLWKAWSALCLALAEGEGNLPRSRLSPKLLSWQLRLRFLCRSTQFLSECLLRRVVSR